MGRYSGRSFRLIFMSVVSILLFVMELVIAHMGNSLSLASDAFAVLSHVLSMIIGLFGLRASNIRQHRKSTYGFLRADVVGAFGNSIFAMALMFSILVEAIKRYINPQKTELPLLVLSAGIIGLFFNVLNYVILDCCYCTAHRPLGDPETGTLNTFLIWGAYVCIFYQVPPVFATAVNCVRWVQSYACLCLKCPMDRMYVMRAPRVCVKYKREQTRN